MLVQVVLRMIGQAVPLTLALGDHAMLVRAVHSMHARVVLRMPALGVPLMLVQVVLRMLGPVAPPTLGPVVHAMLVRVGHAILVPEADGIAQPFADDSKGHMFRKALNPIVAQKHTPKASVQLRT